jgi:Tol biopolymer transport system component
VELRTVHQVLVVVVSLLLPATGSPGQQRHDTDAAWSPNGRSLVFMSDRDGDIEIYTTDLTGGREQRLTPVRGGMRTQFIRGTAR